jgi:GT2 family glycosyltransferase
VAPDPEAPHAAIRPLACPPVSTPKITAVVVAYGAEPWLEQAVHAALASQDAVVDVVLVDNGCTDDAVERLRGTIGVTVVNDGANIGFTGGCNLGARHARGDYLALVNPDAILEAPALGLLAAVAGRREVGLATASVRLADRPELLNCAGLALHFLGVSWSAHFERPASDWTEQTEVFGASGACMVVRRSVWEELGGFVEELFAYYEDCELSLRVRQHGLSVIYVPQAIVVHRYEFSRNHLKLYLADRNRWIVLLTGYERRTLVVLAPALVALELVMFGLAVRQGWARDKLRSWWWLLRHLGWLRQRRTAVQGSRTVSDHEIARWFEARIEPGNFEVPKGLLIMQRFVAAYWKVARRLL